MTDLRVTKHQPWRWPLTLAGVLLVCAAIGWYVYELGQQQSAETRQAYVSEKRTLDMQREELVAAVEFLRTENAELRSQVAVLDKQAQITAKAVSNVRNDLANYRAEIAELKKKLAFYKSIVAPVNGRSGLQINSFELRETDLPLTFTYDLLLVQSKRHERDASGHINIVVHGFLDQKAHVVKLPNMPGVEREDREFEFRYFQRMVGDLVLPSGFGPTRVELVVSADGKSGAKLESSYHWQNLIFKD